ncbi:toxic anion resistance protein [Peptostreptococcus faecalis]|uniref:toxic anion resistance protein n=1 Tax=Peptostreptococcus faecalis TaxID=2045015 RepID=UPI000C795FE0|nr:toxic anion resistance protein [Peptostreptococcus faecalis]
MDNNITLKLDGIDEVSHIDEKKGNSNILNSSLDDTILTEEEMKMVDDFSKRININDSKLVIEYGSGVQKRMSDFSDQTLKTIKSKDIGEVGSLITNLVVELKNFEIDKEDKGIFNFFKRGAKKAQILKTNYESAEANVDSIVKSLEKQQITLMKDISMLDQMYDLNKNYYKEVSMYIIAGKNRIKSIKENEYLELTNRANTSGKQEDVQELNDLNNHISRFEKKLHDLELSRMISIQTAPQIRMVQNNNIEMVEKINSTIVNTIPLWKNQMVLALGVANSNAAIQTQREVSNITNELLKKNADALKMGSIEAAKESQRGIVDIETLKHTNQTLISSLDEVIKIQNEGKEKRQEAEIEISKLENELKQKMIEIATK